jgi:ATP-dependent Lon protease
MHVPKRIRLGKAIEGRDEKGIKKIVCAFLKILHPLCEPTDEEFEEYVAYAVESRRRVKEQMNKRKADDEFANIDLSYISTSGEEIIVYCPESKDAIATQQPARKELDVSNTEESKTSLDIEDTKIKPSTTVSTKDQKEPLIAQEQLADEQKEKDSSVTPVLESGPFEQHYSIHYNDTGHSYESIIGPYLIEAKEVTVEDPYIRIQHQIQNFVRFCETLVKHSTVKKINLITGYDDSSQVSEMQDKIGELKQSLLEMDIELDVELNPNIHDREIRIDTGWVIKIGRGLDFYQKPNSWFDIGTNELSLRRCLETKVDIFRNIK